LPRIRAESHPAAERPAQGTPDVALQLTSGVRTASAARSLLFDPFAAELERYGADSSGGT